MYLVHIDIVDADVAALSKVNKLFTEYRQVPESVCTKYQAINSVSVRVKYKARRQRSACAVASVESYAATVPHRRVCWYAV